MDHEMLAIMEALWHWQLQLVRSSLYIWTIHPLHTSWHNWIFSLANYDELRILLILFYSVVSYTPRDLLISFQMQSLKTLIFLPSWLWTLLCMTSLTRFGLSRSTILSWGGTGITFTVSMLTTMCWQTALVTPWHTEENCIYCGVSSRPSYESITISMVILARYIHKI